MTAPTPVLRFLPDADLTTGPFGILGLPAEPAAPEEVEPALQRQLARLTRHPLGRTTEADEVRLALHVAAAQLRDPRVQEELLLDLVTLRRPRPVAPAPAPTPATQEPPRAAPPPAPRSPAMPAAFDQAALAVIIYSGGWNREAQRRLASLAHVFNADMDAVRIALLRVARRTSMPRGTTINTAAPSGSGETRDLPATKHRWGATVVLCAMLIGSVAMLGVLWRLTRTPEAPAQPTAAATAALPSQPAEPSETEPDRPEEEPAKPSGPTPGGLAARTPAPPAPTPPEIADTVARWSKIARRALERSSSDDPIDSLRTTERLAKINYAALRLLIGDTGPLDALETAVSRFAPQDGFVASGSMTDADLRRMTSYATAPDGTIAEMILLARRSPGQNIEAIKRMMAPTHQLGPADCDALASAAFVGSPPEVRTVARRFIEPQTANPYMVHALLEALPIAPARDEVSALIEQVSLRRLPRPTRPGWRLEARRALLARLAEVLSSGDRETDALAESLLGAWRATSGSAVPAPGTAFLTAGTMVELDAGSQAAAALFESWRDRASLSAISREAREEVDEIDRSRTVERLLAHGVIQRAVIDQKAAAELAGFVVARERPAAATNARRALQVAAEGRTRATHAFQQLEETERAMTALWFLRFGLDAPEERP